MLACLGTTCLLFRMNSPLGIPAGFVPLGTPIGDRPGDPLARLANLKVLWGSALALPPWAHLLVTGLGTHWQGWRDPHPFVDGTN